MDNYVLSTQKVTTKATSKGVFSPYQSDRSLACRIALLYNTTLL